MWVAELLLGTALASECPEPVPPPQVAELLDAAHASFSDLDIEGFIARSDEVRAALPCLETVPEPALVARVHRVEGLRLFGERNVDAVRAFAAARALDPDYAFPPEIAPSGSPILDDYTAMDLSANEPVTLPEPVSGTLWVDGTETRERAGAWPQLVQLLDTEGRPAFTVYLRSGDEVPVYEAVPEPEPEPEPLPEPIIERVLVEAPRKSPRVPLLVATGASAVATGVMYGVAAGSRATWMNPETPDDQLPGLRARTNTLAVASGITGLATLGLGATVAITW